MNWCYKCFERRNASGEASRPAFDSREELKDSHAYAFWEKVETNETDAYAATRLEWQYRRLNGSDCAVLLSLSEQRYFANLNELHLHSNKIGDSGMTAIATCTSGDMGKLQKLYLGNNQIGDPGARALATAIGMGALKMLQVLGLSINQISDSGMAALASAVTVTDGLANLEELYLYTNRIGDSGVKALACAIGTGTLANLEWVYISDNEIGNDGIQALAASVASGALGKLIFLGLNDNHIGDLGLAALAASLHGSAPRMPSLQVLHLGHNSIGDSGLQHLTAAMACGALASLRMLLIGNNAFFESARADVNEVCRARGIQVMKDKYSAL